MTPTTTPPTRSGFNHIVAFEVAKAELVVHYLPAGITTRLANAATPIRRLLKAEMKRNAAQQLGAMLVVCEATGGYEAHVLAAAVKLGIAVHKAHGTRVRHFAKAKGCKAKSDPIDARLIALYGLQTEDLVRYVPPGAAVAALRALDERRHDLKVMLQAETNRLEHVRSPLVRKSLDISIRTLSKMLAAIEAEIARLLAKEAALARKAELMRTVPGVGPVVASTLLAHMPELGTLPRGTAAALAGLAPYDNDSGKRKGRRAIEAGRSGVRRVLYMAAVVAIRVCPHLRAYAQRIIAKGRAWKVAVTAIMRKLITILNAVLASGQPSHYAKPA